MKLIKPSFEIWEQVESPVPHNKLSDLDYQQSNLLMSIYKQIERAGRTCYKSEDKITEGSAYLFVKRLIDSDHLAMLEHGTVYLFFPEETVCAMSEETFSNFQELATNKFTKSVDIQGEGTYITTNLRVIIENKLEIFLKFLCNCTEYHAKRVTVHFICNRQVSHEFVRHRVFSFAQESTRQWRH